jgi:nitrate reductase gamma subunit
MIDVLLYGALPYVSAVLFLVISISRYRQNAFTISSLSSQFLEGRMLYWGSIPLHLGVVTLFFGHLIGFLIPRQVMAFNASPLRLLVLEVTALVAGLLFLVGLVVLVLRRLRSKRIQRVTSPLDFAVYAALFFQVATGLYVAVNLRWGSAWYVHVAVPYLRSLFRFAPDVQLLGSLPLAARLHVIGAFVLIGFFAFTRLMHVLVAPVPYIWRSTQLVLWNRERRSAPNPEVMP